MKRPPAYAAFVASLVTLVVASFGAGFAHAEEIASVNTNFRFTGSDRITVEAYDESSCWSLVANELV